MIEQRKTGLSQMNKNRLGIVRSGTGRPRAGRLGAALLAAAAFLPMAASAQTAPAKVDLAKADKIAQEVCAACHGPDGNSTAPINPKLASQHPSYLYKQLTDFKVQDGQQAAARVNAVMAGFAAMLSDEDMHNLAAYYAAKEMKPSAARNKDTVELGKKIYQAGVVAKGVPACAACHGPRGEGIPAQYPVLHGQYSDYTEAQLVGFRSGARANNGPMVAIADRLSDKEIKAVADYVAGLR